MTVPTLADARRAAERLAEGHGVGQVLLFGSLARGEACEGSDIDLVAVFDDLGDYRTRRDLRLELLDVAEAVAGCAVDLRVTDRAEWRLRCERVSNSFERHVSSDVVALVDLPAGDVDWDKARAASGAVRPRGHEHRVGAQGAGADGRRAAPQIP
ncbi:nucleotidyltransferase family protein [Candidatus Poriferisodalis sp.]|uniref:nucleotidyltransferase family protein n=1 Tax=Candidatus Poriferisodalis sp. TaxID=3101277 RepID=UPI003B01C34D